MDVLIIKPPRAETFLFFGTEKSEAIKYQI